MSGMAVAAHRVRHVYVAHERLWLALATVTFVVAIAIRVPLLRTPLTYANDAWRESDTAGIARHFLRNGFRILYPQVYWGGTGPGYVATEFQIYPLLTAAMCAAWGEHLYFGRLLSLLFFVLSGMLVYAFARRMFGIQGALWALFFVSFAPLSIRYSVAYMPEAMLLFFLIAGLYAFYEWLEGGSPLLLFLCGVSTALAILIKPTALLLGLVYAALGLHRFGLAFLRRPLVWGLALLCLVPGVWWYWHAHRIYLEYGNTFGILEGDTKFGDLTYWLSPSFYISTVRLQAKWVFGGLGVLPFLISLGVAVRRRQYQLITYGAVALVIYYLAVARAAEKWYSVHYHLLSIPFACLGFGLGMVWLWQGGRYAAVRRWIAIAAAVSMLVVAGMFCDERVGAMENGWAQRQVECAAAVSALVPKEARVVVSSLVPSQEHGRPRNYQDPVILFNSDRYGWSLAEDDQDAAHLDALRSQGAEFLVISSSSELQDHPQLGAYLAAEATQIGPGLESFCGIYAFREAGR
jgi:hypothetical protein